MKITPIKSNWFRGSYQKLSRAEREFAWCMIVGVSLSGLIAGVLWLLTPA